MQIDLLGATSAAGAAVEPPVTRQVSGQTAVSSPGIPEDTASLSSTAPDPATLASQALASAGARAAKVEALRQAVSGAQYALEPSAIADAVISSGI